ncbi:MAG: sugar ABC transporter ATP-binding protein [Fimbriimonadaceae bacterium]
MLEITNLSKSFPGVRALDDVNLSLKEGEIRALMGENGAGKSTLIKVLTGAYPRSGGQIRFDGELINPTSPADAQRLGISTVYQELNLAPNLSVAENICLGDEDRRYGMIDWKAARQRSISALDRLGIEVGPNKLLGSLSTAQQQFVAIARALDRQARVLILDEPTSSLDADEIKALFSILKRLKDEGLAILFVTHFLGQVYELCDSITVLRNGSNAGDFSVSECPPDQLVSAMLGRELTAEMSHASVAQSSDEVVLQADKLGRRHMVGQLSFELRRGEVLGLSGLLGSGRTETLRLTYGAETADTGRLTVSGKPVERQTPRKMMQAGLGICPEDRKTEGILPGLSVRENLILALQSNRGWYRPLSLRKQNDIVNEMIAKLGIKTPDGNKPIDQLSGGNQQKVILARWLISNPQILLLDEPTRGIDIGSKEEVKSLIARLASEGTSFLLTSSEIEEILEVCSRTLVLRDREMVAELQGGELNEAKIMEIIAGGKA